MNQHANVLNGSKTCLKLNEMKTKLTYRFTLPENTYKKTQCKYKSYTNLIDYLIT